jgi:diaminopimelate epimerase
MVAKGRAIRFSKEFAAEGINVNFIELEKDEQSIQIRTYERGVENETLSCGTGATAAALICYHNENGFNDVHVKTKGGRLQIEFDKEGAQQFQNIWLCGPAEKIFETTIDLQLFTK